MDTQDTDAQESLRNCGQINIRKDLSEECQIDVLLHELGHILGRTDWHGKRYGLGYSDAYKLWLDVVKE